MSGPRFCRFQLRTTAVATAGEFYDAVIGGRGDGIVKLPAMAAARGAPAHWLGYIGVSGIGGVDAVVARWSAHGATRLGPPRPGEPAILRDPGGAVVAVTDAGGASRAGVVWHQLNTADAARAAALYAELFRWVPTERFELGPALGTQQQFAWRTAEASVGGIADIAGRPGVHPHWLFHFEVPSLDAALAAVRAGGGTVIDPMVMPGGARVAMCEDPQRAAFGLLER